MTHVTPRDKGHASREVAALKGSVEYARSGDATIAYQTLGDGPIDLVFLPGYFSHLELNWEQPLLAWFLRGLASFSRVVLFDGRGTGLSDRGAAPPTLDQRLDDIITVLDALGSQRAAFFAFSEGGSLGALFGARHPDRTSSLVLFNAFARLQWAHDYPWGWGEKRLRAFVEGRHRVEEVAPSLRGDEMAEDWAAKYTRCAVSPGMWTELLLRKSQTDVREELSSITAPTLVVSRSGDKLIPPAHSRYLASSIPGARLVELPGMDHLPWLGDAGVVLDEVEGFLVKKRHTRKAKPPFGVGSLSRRERQVLELACTGASAREIGAWLYISERTVETHIANAYQKLGIRSRVELLQRQSALGLQPSSLVATGTTP